MMERTHIPILNIPKEKKPKSRLFRGSRIRSVSKKMAQKKRFYGILRKGFLDQHPYCQHFISEHGLDEDKVKTGQGYAWFEDGDNGSKWLAVPRSSEVHHKRGRGKYYLDTTTWMACRAGHEIYIHTDPKRYEKGYCLPR